MSQGTFGWRSLRNIRTWQRSAWGLRLAPRSLPMHTGCPPHSRTLPLVLPQPVAMLLTLIDIDHIDPPLFPLPGDGQNRVKNLLQGTRCTLPSGIVPRMTQKVARTPADTDTPSAKVCSQATPRQSLLEQSYCQLPPGRSVQYVIVQS